MEHLSKNLTRVLKLKGMYFIIAVLISLIAAIPVNAQKIGTGIGFHSIVTNTNGKVYAWGLNSNRQLGTGSTANYSRIPAGVDTSGVLNGKTIIAVSMGDAHSLALDSDGRVYAWGDNYFGQLGDGSYTDSSIPIVVDTSGVLGGKTIIKIAAGYSHNLVLDSDGKVYAWGNNYNGELGDNSFTDSSIPVAVYTSGVLDGKTITEIAAGGSCSLALDSDGIVYAWGGNYSGQLGNGSLTDSPVPVTICASGALGGKTITEIAAGYKHCAALAIDGAVYTWGYNEEGELGNDEDDSYSSVPLTVDTSDILKDKIIIAVATGKTHNLVLDSDGKVYAWGNNSYGKLGDSTQTTRTEPVEVYSSGVLNNITITAITAGESHSLALDSDGKVYGWGSNVNGQLGNGEDGTSERAPITVYVDGELSGKTITAIAAGFNHSLALDSDGKVYAWGSNYAGQLGNNSYTDSNVPVAVDVTGVLSGKTIIAIAAGYFFSLALDSDGKVYAWGYNINGQLGDNATESYSPVPVAVNTDGELSGKTITAIAALYNHSLALDSDGKVYAWGWNYDGQLGNKGTESYSTVPVAVDVSGELSDKIITAINVGYYHSIACDSGGKVYAWGDNSYGQLGIGNKITSYVPVAVYTSGDLDGKTIAGVAAGESHSLAFSSEGIGYAWGDNESGQLGIGSTKLFSVVPVAVDVSDELAGKTITEISTGGYFCLALDSDGKVYAWGNNYYGQLGDGNKLNDSAVPVAVDTSGVLSGKTIVAIAGGYTHSLALSSEDTLYAWGANNYGQLGISSNISAKDVPVIVEQSEIGSLLEKVMSFIALVIDKEVQLNWQISTEDNNYGFDIERSTNQIEWSTIGFVEANVTTDTSKEYSFTDSDLPSTEKVSYRLKQIDNDGTFAYSKIVAVDLSSITGIEKDELPTEFSLSQNYPNPFNPSTTIRFSLSERSNVTLIVYNTLGEKVMELINSRSMEAGYHQVEWNASNLSSGIYFYRINTDNGFNSVKKMVLIK